MQLTYKTNFLFCDFETLTSENKQYEQQQHTEILYWYCKDRNNPKGEGECDTSFFNFCLKQKRFVMYFHNLSFDGAFIESIFMRNEFIYIQDKNDWKIYKNCFNTFKINNRIYSIEVWGKTGVHFIFQCTKLLLSASIEQLGKSTGIAKKNDYMDNMGVENFMNYAVRGWNNDKEFELQYKSYCKRDVDIMTCAYYLLEDTLRKYKLLNIKSSGWCNRTGKRYATIKTIRIASKLTIGALTKTLFFSILEDNIWVNKYHLFIPYKNYSFYREWLNGGLTQFNNDYKLKEFNNFYGDDITSAYPYAMTKLLPYGELMEILPSHVDEYIEFVEVWVDYGMLREEYKHIPCLKNINKGGRYYASGEVVNTGIYKHTLEEWNIIEKIYDLKITNKKIWYSRAKNYASDYINLIYPLKKNAKSEGEKLTFKIMLNSLYGKMLENAEQLYQVFADDNTLLDWLDNDFIYLNKDTYKVVSRTISKTGAIGNKLNHIKVQKLFTDDEEVLNPLIGAMITSYCRIQLLTRIMQIPKGNFLYCDTDSIFYLDFPNSQKILSFGGELGDWESEGHFSKGVIMGAKKYKFYKDDGERFKSSFAGMHKTCDNPCELFFNNDMIDRPKNYRDIITINNASFIKKYDDYGIILKRVDKTFSPSKGTN